MLLGLIVLAASMWILQGILGFWQFRRFSRHLRALRMHGRVAIGKAKGRFLAGAVVLFCIDEHCRILRGERMAGLTIFARFRTFDRFNGIYLADLNEAVCAGLDRQTQKAVLAALKDYEDYQAMQQQEAEPVFTPAADTISIDSRS